MDIDDSKIHFDNVDFGVKESSSLTFQIMKWTSLNLDLDHLKDSSFQCPINYNILLDKSPTSNTLTIRCQQCEKNTYPTNSIGRYFHTTSKTKGKNILQSLQNKELECQICPTGALCSDGSIQSRDNFHGFMNEKQEYSFLLCPDG